MEWILLRHSFLECFLNCNLAAGVTGRGAGVNHTWKQRKLEARKMPENSDESPPSSASGVGRAVKD
jgi:hypothetical protein